jgi:hypothetical protein
MKMQMKVFKLMICRMINNRQMGQKRKAVKERKIRKIKRMKRVMV